MNFDVFGGPGTHWVAWICRPTFTVYFDSFGVPMPDSIRDYLDMHSALVKHRTNSVVCEQPMWILLCGLCEGMLGCVTPTGDHQMVERISTISRFQRVRVIIKSQKMMTGGIVMEPQAEKYCVKCRKRTPSTDEARVVLKNGRSAIKGTCTVCGTKKFALTK
jgi:RNase P subunit RPR2